MGLPTGPCPDSRFDATVKLGIGDLMLCQKCDSTRRDEEVLMRQNLTTNATKDCVTIQYKLFNDLHCNECFAATCRCIVCCGVRFGLESRLNFCRHVTDLP